MKREDLTEKLLDIKRENGARAIGHQKDLVGEIDRLVDVMGDHEGGLTRLEADAPHLVL